MMLKNFPRCQLMPIHANWCKDGLRWVYYEVRVRKHSPQSDQGRGRPLGTGKLPCEARLRAELYAARDEVRSLERHSDGRSSGVFGGMIHWATVLRMSWLAPDWSIWPPIWQACILMILMYFDYVMMYDDILKAPKLTWGQWRSEGNGQLSHLGELEDCKAECQELRHFAVEKATEQQDSANRFRTHTHPFLGLMSTSILHK